MLISQFTQIPASVQLCCMLESPHASIMQVLEVLEKLGLTVIIDVTCSFNQHVKRNLLSPLGWSHAQHTQPIFKPRESFCLSTTLKVISGTTSTLGNR